jgi:PTS system glucitol/sorbitol-specific IIC component
LEAVADLLLFAGTPPVAGINDTLGQWAETFIGIFRQGGETFVGLVTGIIPLLIVLLTAVHALIKLIGPERIDRVGEMAGRPGLRYYPIRYLVLPVLAVFFLTNPMAYTMGRFLPERDKPAFYDSAVSFVHPPLGLFPHVNPGELFVYAGIAAGITQLKLPLGDLAVRYFYVGLIVIFMRGITTETISRIMFARRARDAEEPEEPEVTTTATDRPAPEGA